MRSMCKSRRCFSSIGTISAYTVAVLLAAYIVTTILGFVSLESSEDPIEDPYFTLMEIFILLLMPLMLVVMVAFHQHTSPNKQLFSLAALGFLAITTGITSSIHFVIWTVGNPISEQVENSEYLLSFSWPSVAYALDILSWDWFFALSMLFGAFALEWTTRNEKAIRILMVTSGVLSLIGLIAIPLDNMNVRVIGIVGYAVVTIPLFLLLGIYFEHPSSTSILVNSEMPKDDLTKKGVEQEAANESDDNGCSCE